MKKALFASTALVLSAGIAAAEVTFGGNGRFGLTYDDGAATNDTDISYRLRFNIDASKETDSGVKFGGRIRLQYDNGDENLSGATGAPTGEGGAELSAAMIYAEYEGFRVEVGNANTAYDSMSTLYNSEIGFLDSSDGDPAGNYFSFSSGPYGDTNVNRIGVFASYTVGDLVARVSAVDPDQTVSGSGADETEFSAAVDYKFGAFQVGAGFVTDAGGLDGDNIFSITGEYALNDATNIGLQYHDYEVAGVSSNRVTLYGNTKLNGGVQLLAYVANDDTPGNVTDTAYGIGANYDLGGATLAGSIRRNYAEDTLADIGVKFSF
jgi:outer membrane protein OmpU